ncbi:DUF2333 family protein [Litoribrevibacter albus]|uniref:DUF2333 family protein n=1 Tax=Litoribrevibacter albus TaxID=1473156 RepID=A0AA37S5P0_9GAMM|nr:DUF2333 family protein [Litoribrevibacter albus]GLQ29730.1 hypothetical protein GCM10007876_02080 [Litoribrevibacter albus]
MDKKTLYGISGGVGAFVLLLTLIGWYWSSEPDSIRVVTAATNHAEQNSQNLVTGYVTTHTLISVIDTLLNKSGGYISNDIFPPGVAMDNMPNWEFGVLVQVRDLARAFRRDFSRSQSQSTEDKDLAKAEPLLNFDHKSRFFPSSESQYQDAQDYLESYLGRLADPKESRAQFYTRADNLSRWLSDVETRLGSLSQRLSAAVGKVQINTDLAGDNVAEQATPGVDHEIVKTPWLEIDDVFYQTRGSCWALIQILTAIENDFRPVLEKKNARISLKQIIRELESTQESVFSPVILNGEGFGLLANHSLVMASYVARAHAAIIDLRSLLEQG